MDYNISVHIFAVIYIFVHHICPSECHLNTANRTEHMTFSQFECLRRFLIDPNVVVLLTVVILATIRALFIAVTAFGNTNSNGNTSTKYMYRGEP